MLYICSEAMRSHVLLKHMCEWFSVRHKLPSDILYLKQPSNCAQHHSHIFIHTFPVSTQFSNWTLLKNLCFYLKPHSVNKSSPCMVCGFFLHNSFIIARKSHYLSETQISFSSSLFSPCLLISLFFLSEYSAMNLE
jgi:hypothetical protein